MVIISKGELPPDMSGVYRVDTIDTQNVDVTTNSCDENYH